MYGHYVQAKVRAKRDGYEIKALEIDEKTAEQFKRDYLDEDRYDESDPALYGMAGDFEVRVGRVTGNGIMTEAGVLFGF
jgi:hypothetical protein